MPEEHEQLRETFAEIRDWFGVERTPNAFRAMGVRHRYLLGFWGWWKAVYEDRHLDRLTKEMLAYSTAVTMKSAYGIPFFTGLLRRRGVDDATLHEIMAVVHFFCGINKFADLLDVETELTDEEIQNTRAFADAVA